MLKRARLLCYLVLCVSRAVLSVVLGAWSVRFVGWADWVDCRCFLFFVFLGLARRLELSPCNTDYFQVDRQREEWQRQQELKDVKKSRRDLIEAIEDIEHSMDKLGRTNKAKADKKKHLARIETLNVRYHRCRNPIAVQLQLAQLAALCIYLLVCTSSDLCPTWPLFRLARSCLVCRM